MSNVSKLADAINREQQALRTVVDELKSEETYRLAESIRALSEMVNTGECCEDIADAAVQCAVSFLPGANVMAISIDKAQATARILARANCPFTEVGQALPLAADGLLCAVVDEPKRVHRQRCGVDSNIFPERIDFTDDPNDIFVCKAVPRPGAECFALAMLTDEDSLDRASKVLVTLSELLTALCNARGAIEQQNNSARDIVRAKKEWERTVDVLPEIVCLVDADGKVVRSNRTIERWGLGDVTKVAGKDVHELLHKGCRSELCRVAAAMSLSAAGESADSDIESTIRDGILGRTIHVRTQLIPGLVAAAENPQPCAVIVITDISELQQAQDELAVINRSLETRVEARTAELEAANQELSNEVCRRSEVEQELQFSRDELAMLTQQLLEAQEEERRRVSRELHDSLGQTLGGIKYSLETTLARLVTRAPESLEAELTSIVTLVSAAIKETRSLAIGLRPPALDDIGTTAAVESLCSHFEKTYGQIAFHVELGTSNDEIPAALATPIYRIVQESLNNVVKHSSANSALISLHIKGDVLKLEVIDDGIGFAHGGSGDTGTFRKLGKVGRLGMRERALNSGGTLVIDSDPGAGTRVRAEWSLAGR